MKPLLIIAAAAAGVAVAYLARRTRDVELQPTALEQANYERLYREIHGGEA